ncbi:MAG TPA: hypothetical protein VE685_26870, partial [Thermoanaerobaculia bacterium]|nr:hypothetical protein [Thermoanaerobaculia bacterium]
MEDLGLAQSIPGGGSASVSITPAGPAPSADGVPKPAENLPRPSQQSGDSTRELHILHHRDALERIEAILRAPGPSPVLLLSGGPGSGRAGLLQEALRGAGGQKDAVFPLELEGYEEGEGALARFAEHRLALRRDLDEAGREALQQRIDPLLPRLEPSLPGAAVVALLLSGADVPSDFP